VESKIQDNSLDFKQVAAQLYTYANTYLYTPTLQDVDNDDEENESDT
jgi:hypothetical protein